MEITAHKSNELNERLKITRSGPDEYSIGIDQTPDVLKIVFQHGPIPTVGVNGLSIESLLAICADRLECFQSGEFACRENALAITKIEESLHWLHARTRDRVARGVEGSLRR